RAGGGGGARNGGDPGIRRGAPDALHRRTGPHQAYFLRLTPCRLRAAHPSGTAMPSTDLRRGYLLGLAAYVIWGLFPLYFKLLEAIPASEIIVHRVLWSALFGAALLMVWKHPGWWAELRAHPQRLAVLALCGLLIAANWLIYVWAVINARML